jgi:ATP-dependent Clp protease ATP-binding subunit ClpA
VSGIEVDPDLTDKVSRVGMEAVRRKFTPEFINRIGKTVIFRVLGEPELRQILTIELNMLQRRILSSTTGSVFVLSVSESAKDYLLRAGTDLKYGARHLKRAIDQSLVQPLSNLLASGQVSGGDLIHVGYEPTGDRVTFFKQAEKMPYTAMAEMVEPSLLRPIPAFPVSAAANPRQHSPVVRRARG